ncbi:MAG TPA: hypothetical protein VEU96_33285 [Bryobacteraceae bacterium]|nr:hypothetical protein [Bryobacteraceae bacterium]
MWLPRFLPLLAIAALAQQPDSGVNVRHIIGLENIKPNALGKLAIRDGALQFESQAKIPVASIDDIFTGAEITQSGGKAGTVAKTAAMAAPYDSGAALSLLLRTKVDMLTVSYRETSGARHAAIFALPKGQAEAIRTQLIAAGAHTSAAPPALKEARSVTETAGKKSLTIGPSLPALQIELVEIGDIRIPAEFRSAIYERLIEQVNKTGKFQKVFRSGDRAAASYPNLITLHTTVQKFKQGSQMQREITTVLGSTKVDVNTMVTARGGEALFDRDVQGKVRFFGENLGATYDLAKRIAKVLRQSF